MTPVAQCTKSSWSKKTVQVTVAMRTENETQSSHPSQLIVIRYDISLIRSVAQYIVISVMNRIDNSSRRYYQIIRLPKKPVELTEKELKLYNAVRRMRSEIRLFLLSSRNHWYDFQKSKKSTDTAIKADLSRTKGILDDILFSYSFEVWDNLP